MTTMKRMTRMTMMAAVITVGTVIPVRAMRAQVDMVPAAASDPVAAPASPADPQVKDDLFAGTEKFEKGASEVSNVNLDSKMLGMVSGDKDGDVAHKMNFVVVHSYKYDKPGMYNMEDVEAYRKKLTDGSWNCFIHTKDKDGTTDICTKGGENENHEMVILTAEPTELTFVHLSGKMPFDQLGKMGGSMGAPVPPPPPPPAPHP